MLVYILYFLFLTISRYTLMYRSCNKAGNIIKVFLFTLNFTRTD